MASSATAPTLHGHDPDALTRLARSAGRHFPVAVAGLLALAAFPPVVAALPAPRLPQAVGCLGALALTARRWLPHHAAVGRFGAANRITLSRAVGAAWLAGFLGRADALGGLGWGLFAVVALLLALDGVDGWAARRGATASAFGARFDMEVDAALLLVLSALVFELDRAGPWVLGIGGMRYAFVAAGAAVPALRAPLPPSLRRKVICVLQGSALALALSPVAGATMAAPVLAGALAALGASFLLDTVLLLRRPRPSW